MKLKDAQTARAIAENQLATVRATVEATALERTRQLIESPQPVVVPWQEYPAFDDFNRWPASYDRPFPWTDIDDRSEGRYRPLYENESDLRRIRADARRLSELFPVAKGALESLGNYTIGNGYEFKVQPKDKRNATAKAWAPILQVLVDRFLDRNNFVGGLDREIHDESRTDGESFPTLYPDERDVRIELVAPDFILQPLRPEPIEKMLRCNHKLNGWWHGVHTQWNPQLKRDDITRPCGYHAVFDRHGDQWDYLPACRVEHIKRNVSRMSRRGITDFLPVLRDLEQEAKVRRNTAEGAAILAAIVMIRQHAEGATKSSIENMVTGSATSTYDKATQNGARSTSVQNVAPGTVKDTPYGMTTTVGPLGTLRSPVYIEVAQYLLRIISVRWNMTEAQISGDASNNNRASMEAAGEPFVKAREHDQAFYAGHFESLIWKAMAMYHRLGVLTLPWEQLCELLTIKAEYASPATRNKLEQAQTNQILSDAGILSDRSFAADMGLDLDEEIGNGAAKAPPPPSPFGGGRFSGGGTVDAGGGFDDVPRPLGESTRRSSLESLAASAIRSLAEADRWITLDNGVHVKVDDGESVADAVASLSADDGDRVRGDGAQTKQKSRAVAKEKPDAAAKASGEARPYSNETVTIAGNDLEVHTNPSLAKSKRLFGKFKQGVRVLKDKDGNVWAWDAFGATHDQMQRKLKIKSMKGTNFTAYEPEQLDEIWTHIG